ncbi:MAG: EAL domain-containing protein [Steroidobacteraceae bacterium]
MAAPAAGAGGRTPWKRRVGAAALVMTSAVAVAAVVAVVLNPTARAPLTVVGAILALAGGALAGALAASLRVRTTVRSPDDRYGQKSGDLRRDLRTLTDALPSMIGYWDKHLVCRFANRAYEMAFGVEPQAMCGMRMRDLLGEDLFERNLANVEAALRGESVTFEPDFKVTDDQPVNHSLAHYIPDIIDGEVTGFYVMVHNITSLKEAQRRLAESETFLEQAGAVSGVGGFRIDLQSGRQTWTRQTFKIYEMEAEVAPSAEELDKLMAPEVGARLWRAIRVAAETGVGYDIEIPVATARGRPIWIRTIGVVEFESGKPSRVVGAVQDITDRKVDQEALRVTSERLALATDAAAIGVWEWDINHNVLRWDDQMHRLYAHVPSGADVPYSLWTDSLHADDRERTLQEINTALNAERNFDTEFRIVLSTGETRHLKAAAQVQRDPGGTPLRMVGVSFDITKRKAMESQLADAARRDKLTGLANRALFMERLESAVARVRDGAQPLFAVLFLDFDRFKLINDTLGHDAGDELLRQIARRLRRELRASDTLTVDEVGNVVSRFGGDEFLILINDLRTPDDAIRIAERLINALAPAYDLQGSEVHSSASIGIVTSDKCRTNAEDVVRNADVAMYEAKRAGRACSVVFNEAMQTRLTRHVTIENNLRRALGTSELYLVYQPIVELSTGRMVSVEALVRWKHPTLGDIPPSEFVPIAEESGLIVDLGQWVQKEACQAMALWRSEDPRRAPRTISVNVSRAELAMGRRLLEQVHATLERTRLPAQCLQLEVTEREVMRHPEEARALLLEFQALGVQLAMDDFGTGTSSLSCLRNYPFHTIKIDRSFVQDLTGSPDVLAVIHATVNLVENLGMASLAEGVELPAQVAILLSLGCRYAQGYLFSRPVPAASLLDAVTSRAHSEPVGA